MLLLHGPHLVLGSKPRSDTEHSPRLMVSAKILHVSSRASTQKPGKKIHFLISSIILPHYPFSEAKDPTHYVC